jgi:hypothetical protein
MRGAEALQGVRMAVFMNILCRWESAELNQIHWQKSMIRHRTNP